MGRVYGEPGHSLGDGSFLDPASARAETGARAETWTAKTLNHVAASSNGVVIMHDLILREGKYTVNIDHLVVSGDTVTVLDTKMWKPGFYWTVCGTTRRGLTKVPHLDKKSMAMATDFLRRYLDSHGVRGYHLAPARLVVWSSSRERKPNLVWYRPVGATAMSAGRLTAMVERLMSYGQDARPDIVQVLLPLLSTNNTSNVEAA